MFSSQEPGWFDRQENQCGILTARLANEAPQLRKVSGERGGVIVESLITVIVTLALAFFFSWQLALVNMAFMPTLVLFGALQASCISPPATVFVSHLLGGGGDESWAS